MKPETPKPKYRVEYMPAWRVDIRYVFSDIHSFQCFMRHHYILEIKKGIYQFITKIS